MPWIKARRGGVINSIQKYKDLRIRQSLGTDTFPFDLFNDMRMAAVVCKIVENAADAAPSEDVFAMATTGGADALGADMVANGGEFRGDASYYQQHDIYYRDPSHGTSR